MYTTFPKGDRLKQNATISHYPQQNVKIQTITEGCVSNFQGGRSSRSKV